MEAQPTQFSLRAIFILVAVIACIVGTWRGCRPIHVEEVNAWMKELPSPATAVDVERLFQEKGIRLANDYPPFPPFHANRRLHGIIENSDGMGSDIDIIAEIDGNDHMLTFTVDEGWSGP